MVPVPVHGRNNRAVLSLFCVRVDHCREEACDSMIPHRVSVLTGLDCCLLVCVGAAETPSDCLGASHPCTLALMDSLLPSFTQL
jgi:hypothetical protein